MSEAKMRTYTGVYFDVLEPTLEMVRISDIAHSLSCQGRFAGHARQFYSVAQHSVLCAQQASNAHKLCALLHDATEAYLVDLPRPVKYATPLGKQYRVIEDILWEVVATKFKLPRLMPDEIKTIDHRMVKTEMRDLMGCVYGNFTFTDEAPYEQEITPLVPRLAEQQFLNAFVDLGGRLE